MRLSSWTTRDARNLVNNVGNVDCAVFVSHGLNDNNVKTEQFSQWYKALKDQGVPHKIILHQRGHGDWPYYLRGETWLHTLNRWWTRWLYGVENGIMDEPTATIQRRDTYWETYDEWPAPDTDMVEMQPTSGGRTSGGLTRQSTDGDSNDEEIVDEPSIKAADLADAGASPHRLVYKTEPLDEPLRVSGTAYPDLQLSFNYPAANVTTMLVDYTPEGSSYIINRGWTDPQNRNSIRESTPVKPGTDYDIEFNIQPDDYTFQPGHRIGIVVLSSDHDYTKRPPEGTGGTVISMDVDESSIKLPVVGGSESVSKALPNKEEPVFPTQEDDSESEPMYYQVDLVVGEPIIELRGEDGTENGTYENNKLIRFAHGSTDEAVTRRSDGEFITDEDLADRIDSQNIAIEDGTAKATFTVAEDSDPIELSLVSYTKPEAEWSPETESEQEYVDGTTDIFSSGTHTLSVAVPTE